MSFFSAVIPDGITEYSAVNSDTHTNMPKNMVALRINDISSGTALELEDMGGTSVVWNGLAVGDEVVGRFRRTLAAGTTLDEIIVQSVI